MIEKALRYLTELKEEAMKPQVVEIAGKTYCDKSMKRYDDEPLASSIEASTLTAMVDYIRNCGGELRPSMILHVVSPTKVRLYSGLTKERKRECLFESSCNVPSFQFDKWQDQERFLIELQACFEVTEDMLLIQKVAGNVEAKTTANYGDDGVSQKTTIRQGIASKTDVIVPNPVTLKPYRTFLEIDQPVSEFVFRIGDEHDKPTFKLIEAQGGLWKNKAMADIKDYFAEHLADLGKTCRITIIA